MNESCSDCPKKDTCEMGIKEEVIMDRIEKMESKLEYLDRKLKKRLKRMKITYTIISSIAVLLNLYCIFFLPGNNEKFLNVIAVPVLVGSVIYLWTSKKTQLESISLWL